jgi:hypothetical protein
MNSMRTYKVAAIAIAIAVVSIYCSDVAARPTGTKNGGGSSSTLTFKRQKNTLSNLDFYFTNKGVLFNNDQAAGLNWPRGTSHHYIFGGGLWFATKKVIAGKKKKLVELGYNPNSGAGWYTEGEKGVPGNDNNYISYLSPRYSNTTGAYDHVPRTTVPDMNVNWPIWDTSESKTLKHNYYFGDYISDNDKRKALAGTKKANGTTIAPAMLSQEDIVNVYSDYDITANPEYKQGAGYPFNLNIVEVIYSWSFGRYRDMIFIRHKVTNTSDETLYDCFIAPAFDPDLGDDAAAAANDFNSYFGLTPEDITRAQKVFPKGSLYYEHPEAMNLGTQWSKPEGGKEYGVIGFSFLESPVTDPSGNVIDISDSEAVQGYGKAGVKQLGLTTFKKWTITNDPPTPDLRYDFIADGGRDHDPGTGADLRLLFGTGPFNLPPHKSVETTVGIGIVQASTTDIKLSKDSILKVMAFAQLVFADTTGSNPLGDTTDPVIVKHFITPGPPALPNIKTHSLDRAVLVTWDSIAENTPDPLSPTLPFNTYELYRTTRSDHDSTIRPDGVNPTIKLGTWSIWNFDANHKRTNATPNVLPHSYLDYGDDNADGQLTGSEGLLNGVKYYYFLIATDEYDSVNKVGPLSTAIVQNKNFAVGIPSKPVFPDLGGTILSDANCIKGNWTGVRGIDSIILEVVDTGKFVDLYTNDNVNVSFLPRWSESSKLTINNPLSLYINLTDERQGKIVTFDRLYNPNATPQITPYNMLSGIVQGVVDQHADSNVAGRFVSDNNKFAPYQTIDQAFRLIVDFEFQQMKAPYRLKSITIQGGVDPSVVQITPRTAHTPINNLADIPDDATMPSYLGGLGEVDYEVSFGDPTGFREIEADTNGNTYEIRSIKDPNSSTEFNPQVLPVTITSKTHCDAKLKPMRNGNRNDYTVENLVQYYGYGDRAPATNGDTIATYSQPDTMKVPQPGKFALDAYHFTIDDPADPGGTLQSNILTTSGASYFPLDPNLKSTDGKHFLATIHRLRLAGAEIIFNYPHISSQLTVTGDSVAYLTGPVGRDFNSSDKILISFRGLVKGLPFPDSSFVIHTSKTPINLASNSNYEQQQILDQVQVVPNPYIVTHLGQASTDNSKLFFTRLPPRATIEIYTLAGDLVNTLEHQAYTLDGDNVNLNDRYRVEEWNLLTSGRQRVGSQVLVARIIAKDPKSGAVLGETTKKFAVILGGYRQVVGQ